MLSNQGAYNLLGTQAMTESMRKGLGVHHGIRASTISPGVINTGWADKVTDPAGRQVAQELE